MKSFLIVYNLDGARLYGTIAAENHADAAAMFELAYALGGNEVTIETVQFLG